MKTATLLLIAAQLLSKSILAQCALNSTPPLNSPVSISNVFSSGDEGFTGDFQWEVVDENLVTTMPAPGTKSLVTPIYYTTDDADIVLQFDLTMLSDAEINSYKIFAQTAGNSSILVCNETISPGISPGSTTPYFLTVPAGHIPIKTPFKLMISFEITGSSRAGLAIDNFGANIPSMTGTLPVEFGWFRANRKGNMVHLQWKSELEENTRNYVVERSLDGKAFKNIGTLSAKGRGTYFFADEKPEKEGYYRIKAIDHDFKFNYSTIAKIKLKESTELIKAFWRQRDVLVVQHELATSVATIQLVSTEGKVLTVATVQVNSGETVLNVPYTAPGVIIVRMVSTSGNTELTKLARN